MNNSEVFSVELTYDQAMIVMRGLSRTMFDAEAGLTKAIDYREAFRGRSDQLMEIAERMVSEREAIVDDIRTVMETISEARHNAKYRTER